MNMALNAYRSAAQSFDAASLGGTQKGETIQPGQAFSDMVKDNLSEAVDAGKKSEQMSLLALQGKADMREVVNAVANAETALQTVVAVRDKVLSAYQEILKMSI
ncbi:MAG: flagellar hook-basal body complex protein FliE [Rhodospirillaceae bacterium]|nr:flagellar hook-basal body complex protein FliE [Rhodospirillaceae bacterium]